MAGDYTTEHASALADVREAGQDVTFTKASPGTHAPSTGTFTGPSSTTVTGAAVRVDGNPKRYAELGLKLAEDPTLFFVPDTYGQVPDPGATVSFGSVTYRVVAADPFAPSASAIFARVMVTK